MYDNETKNQFIELRAEGLSLDAIASRLNAPPVPAPDQCEISNVKSDIVSPETNELASNPEGIGSSSPGLRGTSYPGTRIGEFINPNGVVSIPSDHIIGLQPLIGQALKSHETVANPNPPSANAVRDSATDQSKIQNPQSKIDSPSSAPPRLCGEPPDTPPLISTPLQRGEPAQPIANTTASAVSPCNAPNPQPSETIQLIPQPVGVPSSDGPRNSAGAAAGVSPDDANPIVPKKHKPYWINGHYYETPNTPKISPAPYALALSRKHMPWRSNVAQVSNLLYRRFPIGRYYSLPVALETDMRPIDTLATSRLGSAHH